MASRSGHPLAPPVQATKLTQPLPWAVAGPRLRCPTTASTIGRGSTPRKRNGLLIFQRRTPLACLDRRRPPRRGKRTRSPLGVCVQTSDTPNSHAVAPSGASNVQSRRRRRVVMMLWMGLCVFGGQRTTNGLWRRPRGSTRARHGPRRVVVAHRTTVVPRSFVAPKVDSLTVGARFVSSPFPLPAAVRHAALPTGEPIDLDPKSIDSVQLSIDRPIVAATRGTASATTYISDDVK